MSHIPWVFFIFTSHGSMTTKSPPKYKVFFNMLKGRAAAAYRQIGTREALLVKNFKYIYVFQVSVRGYML